MSELADLYQEIILDHGKRPRNCRALGEPSCHANGHNPLCGDRVTVFVKIEDGKLADVSFIGKGCAICTASASLMTEGVKGKTTVEAETLFDQFHHMLTDPELDEKTLDEVGKLAVLSGVRKYPVRVKCATLPWHTLHAALQEKNDNISTE